MGSQKDAPEYGAAFGSVEEYIKRENANDTRKFFSNPGFIPEIEFFDPVKRSTYNISKFRFDSTVYTRYKKNNIVSGRYYERHGRPDLPLVILLHGWRMDSYMLFDRYCRLLVKNGFNCFMPDLPYHMNRTPKQSFAGEYTFRDDAIHTMETMRQAVFDIMSIINWANKYKNPRLIGCMGVSFGGMISGLMACVEPQLNFSVMIVPPSDLGRVFTESRLGHLFERENPKAGRLVKKYAETMSIMALTNQKPIVPKENIFIAEGLYDTFVPPVLIEELWRAWDRPKIKRYPHGHLSVILFNPKLESDLRKWLKKIYYQDVNGNNNA
ncbi:MAG TPA: alpha/beta fold hydrolase [bacterium]|nr:alpha/beta fold hydrolase [bacterium]